MLSCAMLGLALLVSSMCLGVTKGFFKVTRCNRSVNSHSNETTSDLLRGRLSYCTQQLIHNQEWVITGFVGSIQVHSVGWQRRVMCGFDLSSGCTSIRSLGVILSLCCYPLDESLRIQWGTCGHLQGIMAYPFSGHTPRSWFRRDRLCDAPKRHLRNNHTQLKTSCRFSFCIFRPIWNGA